jgi:membrane protease YdiL (CAAX protease family)
VRAWLVHPEERRLRAPFRLALWLCSAVGCAAAAAALAAVVAPRSLLVALVAQSLAALAPTLLCARFVDRRPLGGVGLGPLRRLVAHGLLGAGLGAGLIGLVAAIEHATGAAHYAPRPADLPALSSSLGVMLLVALDEEVLFRGYLLTNLGEAWGGRRGVALAALVSSLAFGAAHALNPSVGALALLDIALAGGLLALPYVLTGELGLSIGLHLGWNLAQAWLGMAVSGNALPGALVARTLTPGEELWTGGPFGPEGGLLGLGALGIGALVTAPLAWSLADDEAVAQLGRPPASSTRPTLIQRAPAEAHPVEPIELGPARTGDVLEPGHDARARPGTAIEAPPQDPFGEL